MRSPGAPSHRREVEREFWREIAASFDWDFDEVHRRLVGLDEERGTSAEALDGLVVCVDKLEQMTARDLIRAIAQP